MRGPVTAAVTYVVLGAETELLIEGWANTRHDPTGKREEEEEEEGILSENRLKISVLGAELV